MSRGRLAEFACDRGCGSQGRVLVGYVVAVSGFDVGHRLSALRLFAEDDGGKPAGAAAVVVGVAPENRDVTADVAAQVVGPGRRDRIIESVRDGRVPMGTGQKYDSASRSGKSAAGRTRVIVRVSPTARIPEM